MFMALPNAQSFDDSSQQDMKILEGQFLAHQQLIRSHADVNGPRFQEMESPRGTPSACNLLKCHSVATQR
jgi:hypothetical protein